MQQQLGMNEFRMRKNDVLAALRKNLAKHDHIYQEAIEQYRRDAIKRLKDSLKQAKNPDAPLFQVSSLYDLDPPKSIREEFEEVIQMLEMCIDDEISLSKQQVREWVRGKMRGMNDFIVSNAKYSSVARSIVSTNDD